MSNYIKCASIYYQQSSNTNGTFDGTTVGIGGDGLVLAGTSGRVKSATTSQLAAMFSPLDNPIVEPKQSARDFYAIAGCVTVLLSLQLRDHKILNMIVCMIGIYFIVNFISAMSEKEDPKGKRKYAESTMTMATANWNSIYYNPQEHTIFKNDKFQIPATRENFEKLLLGVL